MPPCVAIATCELFITYVRWSWRQRLRMRIGCGIGVKAIAIGFDFFGHELEITRINREIEI